MRKISLLLLVLFLSVSAWAANSVGSVPYKIDTAMSSSFSATTGAAPSKGPYQIAFLYWSAPTTAGHKFTLVDQNGTTIATFTATAATVSQGYYVFTFTPSKIVKDFQVTAIDSGALYIYTGSSAGSGHELPKGCSPNGADGITCSGGGAFSKVTVGATLPANAPAGSVGAVTYYGDGSNLTGVVATGTSLQSALVVNVKEHGVEGDGVTDDAPALNALVDLQTGPAVLYFPAGTYIIGASLKAKTQISWRGAGAGKTILKWQSASDMTSALFQGSGCTSGSPCTDVEFADMEMDGSAATQAGGFNVAGKAIYIQYMKRAKIHDIYAHDFPATCIGVDYLIESDVSHNTTYNCGRIGGSTSPGSSGIGIGTGTLTNESVTISDNTTIDSGHYGILVESQSTSVQSTARVTVTGNVVIKNIDTGASGISAAGQTGDVIANNVVVSTQSTPTGVGIAVNGGTLGIPSVDTLIEANQVYGWGFPITIDWSSRVPAITGSKYKVLNNHVKGGGYSGIYVNANSTTAMPFVEISGNTVETSKQLGIYVAGGAAGVTNLITSNNTLIGNGQSSGGWTQAGLGINTTVANWISKGNVAYDDGSGKQKYGLEVYTSGNITTANLQDNDFRNNVTSAINNQGTLSCIDDAGTTVTCNASKVLAGTMTIGKLTKTTAAKTVGDATSSDVVGLFGSGSCSGYLKSDGTCGTPAGTGSSSISNTTSILKGDNAGNALAAGASDVVSLFNSGTCSGYLKSDGTCATPAGGASVASTTAMLKGDNAGNAVAAAATDVVGLFNSGTCSGYLKSDGTCSTPAGGATIPSTTSVLKGDNAGGASAALAADVVSLFGSGSCSGYLKSDGTCSTPSGGNTPHIRWFGIQLASTPWPTLAASSTYYCSEKVNIAPSTTFGNTSYYAMNANGGGTIASASVEFSMGTAQTGTMQWTFSVYDVTAAATAFTIGSIVPTAANCASPAAGFCRVVNTSVNYTIPSPAHRYQLLITTDGGTATTAAALTTMVVNLN